MPTLLYHDGKAWLSSTDEIITLAAKAKTDD